MPEAPDQSRELVLGRIREANSGADAETCAAEYAEIRRAYQCSAQPGSAQLDRAEIARIFIERLREYDARVYEAAGSAVRDVIVEIFKASGQRSAVVARQFPEGWLPEQFAWQPEADSTTDAMGRAEGAITGCVVAIAHTGTIVVRGSRRVTLLPDRLLCVVEERQIVETVPEAFERLQPYAKDALTFISGPSATADIEMTRIRGVHGPRFLDVVLARDE